jgi:Protein of unknown function (DUF1800)
VVAAAHGRGRQPLREKLTLFWHSHFATSIQKVRQPRLMYQQNELLRTAGAVAALRPWEALLDAADREPLEPGTGVLVLVTLYGGNDGLNTVIPTTTAATRTPGRSWPTRPSRCWGSATASASTRA